MRSKISIITITYNNLEGLKKTFDSVCSQTWKGYEHIIIDGGSNDGTRAYLESLDNRVSYWVSEPDNGVYQAMNKGIKKATGDYLVFLNSGDHFYNNKVLEKNIDCLGKSDIIYFNLQVIGEKDNFIKEYPEVLSFSYFVKDTLPHPATFIKKEVFDKVGLYDESLKIVSDWKFFMDSICKNNISYQKINAPLSTFYLDGMSSNSNNKNVIVNERQGVLNSEYAVFVQDLEDVIKYRGIISGLRQSRIINLLVKLGFLNKI
ncbi:glycosyltransferase family 2 protein [Flavivirga jejuensis]|uniref:Glycosyltransferase family 2 protein n=1 Tax=Flavivirga jejuensis TaxID=870487 RepID=A0ABT8WU38_9FLAO|nr:glycosyltransferase family 2 protein [Flavivirga jejuensis]MDO5976669.1 glycosyltransferase family 2 protein [Flavivirga jejuensis]